MSVAGGVHTDNQLFIYCLLNDTVNVSHHTASNGRTNGEWKTEKDMEVVNQPRYWGEPRNISIRISYVPAKTRTQHFPITSHESYRYSNLLGHTFSILNELFNDAVNCYENTASVLRDWVWINGRMIPTGENQSTSRKTCPKNPTRTFMELNPGIQNEKSASPVSKHSPKFLLPGVGYRVTTSVVSEALLNRVTSAARQVWVLPSLWRVCVKYKAFPTSFGTQEDLMIHCFQKPLIH